MIFAADLEATTNPEDCRVWSWRFEDLASDYSKEGLTLSELLSAMLWEDGSMFYFHNLRYDGTFLLTELINRGYRPYIHMGDKKSARNVKLPPMFFKTLITSDLKYYEIQVCAQTGERITIRDSLKLIPLSEEAIAKKFGMELAKGTIDYDKERPIGYQPTGDEWSYLRTDVGILKNALNAVISMGVNKMTIGASALSDFKSGLNKGEFRKLFPDLSDIDAYLRAAYRGGYCIANPKYKGREMGDGYVLDKNSMYPGVMVERPLPYGTPLHFKGEYEPDPEYPLYVCRIRAWLELKEGHLPTVQIKNNPFYKPEEYITTTEEEPIILHVTHLDLERIKENYNYTIEYLDGYKFRASTAIFKGYVEKWYKVKEEADKSGDGAMRQIAKLMENNLYGKFGVRLHAEEKIPYLQNGKLLHRWPYQEVEARSGAEAAEAFQETYDTSREPVYLPVALFVTAWARYEISGLAQAHHDNFLYCDTDSLHMLGDKPVQGIRLHDSALGAWKKEGEFIRGKYLRAKAYIEELITDEGTETSVHCAGMPKGCHKEVTFDNFKTGSTFNGKLLHKNVVGGQVLIPTTFTIKG